MTHCRSESVASSSVWMSGSATFTIVMSSNSMKTPRQTAVRVHHFGSRGDRVLGESGATAERCDIGLPLLRQRHNHQLVNDYLMYDTHAGEIVKRLTTEQKVARGRGQRQPGTASRACRTARTPLLASARQGGDRA